MMAGTVRPPVCFVAREEPVHTSGLIASDRHQGTPQSTNEHRGVTTRYEPSWNVETDNVVVDHNRCHEPQPHETPVSQRQWPSNLFGEH